MTLTLDKLIKGVAGAIVLAILLVVVLRWWGDYRLASTEARFPETTTTAPAATQGEGSEATPAKTGEDSQKAESESGVKESENTQVVIVQIEGLNFREKADRGSRAIRALSKGEKVQLLDTIDSWYQVKDADGSVGWISSNPAYSKIEK